MVQLAVILADGDWTVFRDGKPLRRGMSRSRAIEQAQDLAATARAAGNRVELLLHGYNGELSTWRDAAG